ncbi:hypothetical protein CCHR01_13845 [Colletotrichum chrysophilum]|uniref:Uncharacterized protein n=1 Tax=Colletotrichum chrysophilum TaxID=1836956 RepID=A0AAD9ECU4_9PEZI|nr:hypothetical protein CCHR01_13845 [Colletotrichum chrysophilum]
MQAVLSAYPNRETGSNRHFGAVCSIPCGRRQFAVINMKNSAVAKNRSRRVDKTVAGPRDPGTRPSLQQPYVLTLHVARVYWLRPWPLVGSPKSQQLSTTTRNLRPRHGNHLAKLSRLFFLACEDRFPPGLVAQERKFTGLLRTEGAELHGSLGARTRGCSAPEAFTG